MSMKMFGINVHRKIDLVAAALILAVILHSAYLMFNEYTHQVRVAVNVKEADPLRIESTDHSTQRLKCSGDVLNLYRHIEISKPITVAVQRSIIALEGPHKTTTSLHNVEYSELHPVTADVKYRVKISGLIAGKYLYRPILTYKVNEYLTITKPAPTQYFEVYCDKDA